ncbi:MAG: nickel pincer cofactor biosynthesis protein LarC [Thermodesulfovibrionales bacterium]|nr:nickel pincer cofactor biosynthesis protein LarC [Thermodesulfovibrionales bacterium]
MRVVYFDCFSGISGDMCLGAFVDAGMDMELLVSELKKIPLDEYKLEAKKVIRGGISATKVDVLLQETEYSYRKGRKWRDIVRIVESSKLEETIKIRGLELFKRLFEVEAKIHGMPFEDTHLHELAATDCIVDIFGTLIALHFFQADTLYTSEINLGSGVVNTSHGTLPVPAPATLELLQGYPLYSSGLPFELTTPTGALIISGLNALYSSLPSIIVEKVGYGAGQRDIAEMPNFLRVIIGRKKEKLEHSTCDVVTVIETNIDDMNPQFFENTIERLFDAGALDVTLENIIMKKGRPALRLSVIAKPEDVDMLSDIIFENTSTIGIRFFPVKRKLLFREVKTVQTSYGILRIKISKKEDKIFNITPEYDDLKALAVKTGMPLKRIFEAISKEIQQKLHCQ